MAFETTIVSHSYAPGSAMSAEAIPFPFLNADDLRVTHIADATGVRTELVPDHYVIAGDGPAKAGTIAAVAAWPDDDLFLIERVTPIVQKAVIPSGQPIPAKSVEQQLDRMAMVAQELDDRSGDTEARAVRAKPGQRIDPLDVTAFLGRYLWMGPAGQLLPVSGGGADDALRTDLAEKALAGKLIAFAERSMADKAGDIVSVLDAFPLAAAGLSDFADACDAAVAMLPPEGGRVLIPRGQYVADRHVSDGGKPVLFELESGAHIVGPIDDWVFVIGTSGSGVVGQSAEGCSIELRAPSTPLLHGTANVTIADNVMVDGELADGVVTAATVATPGSGYASQPMAWATRSVTRHDAGLVATVDYDAGELQSFALGASGKNYAAAPSIRLRGGGYGAIKNDGARRTRYENLFVDMKNIPNACGFFLRGGWYVAIDNVGTLYDSDHDSALFLAIESYTRGFPGPDGSWGGAYVNVLNRVRGKRIFSVGHDTSTGTTTLISQPECLHLHLHACVYYDIEAPVMQPNGATVPTDDGREALFDFLNVDVVNIWGGDFETPNRFGPANGRCIMFRSTGSCRNVRIEGTGTNAWAGTIEDDRLGVGSRVVLSDPTQQARDLKIGLADEWRQPGWSNLQRSGFYWAGNAFVVSSSNVRVRDDAGTLKGTLDDTTMPGQALVMDTSRQLYLLKRVAGAGELAMSEAFKFDAGGLAMEAGAVLTIGGKRVTGERLEALPADATDLTTALALVNAIKARMKATGGHGLVED